MTSLLDRLTAKVDVAAEGGCWRFTGAHDRGGYGSICVDGRMVGAHRVAYELLVEPIDGDLTVDHLCHVRDCVNPDHLALATGTENRRRNAHSLKTHCPQGHPYDEENTVWLGTFRRCRACRRVQTREAQRRRRAR